MTPRDLIVAALRDPRAQWPADRSEAFETQVLDEAASHDVEALLAAAPGTGSWPVRVRSTLVDVLRFEAAVEAARRPELQRLLSHLDRAGVRSLLLKGGQLAYVHYPQPWLRPRLDTDLLVRPSDRLLAAEVLQTLGYRPATGFGGELVSHQFQYERLNGCGVMDTVDLHWRIANPHAFAEAFTFDELEQRAMPIPVLSAQARGPSDADALLLACIHRVAHHSNSTRLIWLLDIHLLTRSIDDAAGENLASLALSRGLGSVCASGIREAAARFRTSPVPSWVKRLQTVDSQRERTAVFLASGRTKLDVLRSDLQVLKGWRPRMKMIGEHLFPPVDYIRHTYGRWNPAFIPFAYAYRIAKGIPKWVSSPRSRPGA